MRRSTLGKGSTASILLPSTRSSRGFVVSQGVCGKKDSYCSGVPFRRRSSTFGLSFSFRRDKGFATGRHPQIYAMVCFVKFSASSTYRYRRLNTTSMILAFVGGSDTCWSAGNKWIIVTTSKVSLSDKRRRNCMKDTACCSLFNSTLRTKPPKP